MWGITQQGQMAYACLACGNTLYRVCNGGPMVPPQTGLAVVNRMYTIASVSWGNTKIDLPKDIEAVEQEPKCYGCGMGLLDKSLAYCSEWCFFKNGDRGYR
jgi:hypothetical protein